jgi:hypothetical protein
MLYSERIPKGYNHDLEIILVDYSYLINMRADILHVEKQRYSEIYPKS